MSEMLEICASNLESSRMSRITKNRGPTATAPAAQLLTPNKRLSIEPIVRMPELPRRILLSVHASLAAPAAAAATHAA
jgi:hypothetical protein